MSDISYELELNDILSGKTIDHLDFEKWEDFYTGLIFYFKDGSVMAVDGWDLLSGVRVWELEDRIGKQTESEGN